MDAPQKPTAQPLAPICQALELSDADLNQVSGGYDENTIYMVVMNHEEQYSIWPADREIAPGWKPAGFSGDKSSCLDHILNVWTDMRPLSLRKAMGL